MARQGIAWFGCVRFPITVLPEYGWKKESSVPQSKTALDHVKPTHISVTFKIVTPDQLRKITFTLSRLSDAQNDSWSVMFELDQRADATKDFQLVIQLQVDVDHHDDVKAADTAKNGLDSHHHAHALVAAA